MKLLDDPKVQVYMNQSEDNIIINVIDVTAGGDMIYDLYKKKKKI